MHRSVKLRAIMLWICATSGLALGQNINAPEQQQGPVGEKTPAGQPAHVTGDYAKLELTDDQRAKVAAIQADIRAKIAALREQEEAQVQKVLADEQKVALAKQRAEEAERRRANIRERRAAEAASLRSIQQVVRSQLELFQVQHRGQYPVLDGDDPWAILTSTTDASSVKSSDIRPGHFGPYLLKAPVNPFTGSSTIGTNATDGWQIDRKGTVRAIFPGTETEARALGLDTTNEVLVVGQ